jgi:hypothetical protein
MISISIENRYDQMSDEELKAEKERLEAKLNTPKINDWTRVMFTGALKMVNEALERRNLPCEQIEP